ncbi:MAG: GNAT family N-acetyltransferase [Bacteroidetes bacterium]|nr:MAG: GNAT family N-acetyltransferase [Bacteroidota bacterium]REK05004.1 MAG: GNAT family N-acetyltransferase [Bacteroidota bacterium]REK36492.1 MAG: GNAT family N-acetyltransferase [Bacteroidota bacterium]REK51706.1 MAG: GNAT family N-acetyltransferase [Bacteroidota bacterium]
MEEYSFQRLNESHYNDLRKISLSAFGFDPGYEYYSEKNNTHFLGHSNLGYIAYSSKGEPAAFYGMYAYPVMSHGKRAVAAQSGDTMTHKDHMGKGLFTKLAKLTYELAAKEGVSFVFGFPNKNSYPGFVRKLNWTHRENLIEYRIPITTLPFLKVAKRFKFFEPLYKILSSAILKKYITIPSAYNSHFLSGRDSSHVERKPEFLQYKMKSGSVLLEISGKKVWIKLDGYMYLGDVESCEPDEFKGVIRELISLARLLGADKIIYTGSEADDVMAEIQVKLNRQESLAIGYLDFLQKDSPENMRFTQSDLDTF